MSEEPDDLLHAATRALREETARESSAARFTRLRVMASLRESEVRRRTQTVLLLPFAACLTVVSAWGMAVGGVTEMRNAVVEALGLPAAPPDPPPAPAKPRPRRKLAPAPVQSATPAPPAETQAVPPPAPTAVLAPPAPSPSPSPARPPALANAPAQAPKNVKLSSAPDPSHELYRDAHRAHFTRQDWHAALAAWDRYLAAAPRGRLSTEARYNRALCLVRLGRSLEAGRALEPFAARVGGYRQKEAAALLQVLSEK
jgi:hypothetical protein